MKHFKLKHKNNIAPKIRLCFKQKSQFKQTIILHI
jgi:hypothetical protein